MTSCNLDATYFRTVTERTDQDANVKYRGVRPIGNPIVLFSLVDGLPLAAIHIRASSGSVPALFTKRPRSEAVPCDFQGLIGKDSEEFSFVITNLCYEGFIDFNILLANERVTVTVRRILLFVRVFCCDD